MIVIDFDGRQITQEIKEQISYYKDYLMKVNNKRLSPYIENFKSLTTINKNLFCLYLISDNTREAARILNINYDTLYYRLKIIKKHIGI